MKNKKLVLCVVVLLVVSLSCNFLFPDSQSHVTDLNGISQNAANLPLLDPEGPLPSPSAAQLRTLLANEPGSASLIGDVETAEKAAMQAAVADLKALLKRAGNTKNFAPLEASPFAISTFTMHPSARQSPIGDVFLVSFSQPSIIQPADGGLSVAAILGLLTSMFSDYFAVPESMPIKSFSDTEKAGDVTSDMSMEIGKSQDGSSHFGLGFKDEGTQNGVSFKTEMSAIIDGQRCPTADGQVSFSVKARIRSESGGTGTTQDLTTFVRATVGDDAEITGTTLDITQGTRQVKDGRNVYVETGITYKYPYKDGVIASEGASASNWREIRTSQQTTPDDITLVDKANTAAVDLAISSLESAKFTWQNGGCIKIVATSPGTVQPGSTTAIPVNVISIFDGSNAPSKLKAALTGAEAIDPTSLATTPGSLSYRAPNEKGKSATILLTATSRRGKAKLELAANTGGTAFHISGALGDMGVEEGNACDVTKPFTLHGPVTMVFTPTDEKSGSFKFADGPFADRAAGPYTIGNGSLLIGGSGCVDTSLGTFCNKGSLTFTVTPIDPGSCVP